MPQGSILGTLLFNIYINEIVFSRDVFNFIMYADDTALITSIEHFDRNGIATGIKVTINDELSKTNEWFTVNKLSLNINKTKAMVFHTAQKKLTFHDYK